MWFIKTVRSGARDAEGNLPPEVWAHQPVSPTLNIFDNTGESRATVLIIETPVLMRGREGKDGGGKGPLLSEDISLTIATANDQVLFTAGEVTEVPVFPIQSTVIGRQDHNGPQGKGYGMETDPMFTLDRAGAHGVATEAVVRRLTPTECERLQGFPDGWTEDQADSHRYKQMGNAVTVNVIEWIGARL